MYTVEGEELYVGSEVRGEREDEWRTRACPVPTCGLGQMVVAQDKVDREDTMIKPGYIAFLITGAYLLDVDIENTECVKLAISKGLGIGIVGASAIVKVPQILKLLNSKSADGVSFLSYLLETSAYLISLAYNVRNGFPFSTFGETAFIMGQNVIISVLVLNYSGKPAMAATFIAALAVSAAALFANDLIDMQALSYLQAGAGVLGVASKVPQILAIWQEGGTGQLSAFAVSLPPAY